MISYIYNKTIGRPIGRVRRKLFPTVIYQVGAYKMHLPASAKLPILQSVYPLYDRFLPVLAQNLDADGTIVDVGANVGDTLVAMIQGCKNTFLCVEPSDFFFRYLEKNVSGTLKPEDAKRVRLVKSLVGTGKFLGELKSIKDSTATVVLNSQLADNQAIMGVGGNLLTVNKLDNIVDEYENIVLLKSDVDGFDFDVLQSAEKILSKSEPVLFWENQIDHDFQREGFDNLYEFLQAYGYVHIYIFDNFGNLMVEKADYHTLRSITDYADTMRKYNTTRTICYTDVLAATDKRLPIIERAIDDYKKSYITKQ